MARLAIVFVFAATLGVGCSTSTSPTDAGGADTGAAPSDAGGAIDAAAPVMDAGGAIDAATPVTDSGGAIDAPTSGDDAATTTDPFAMARQTCIDEINRLRGTRGLALYAAWTGVEMCVDAQATSDEMTGVPHGAWLSGTYSCNGAGQNECEGAGVAGIAGCLDLQWAEGEQPGCSGCDACADAFDPSCPNCDYYGTTTGTVCGHYVNLSARYFTEAACGFSSLGGSDVINFQ